MLQGFSLWCISLELCFEMIYSKRMLALTPNIVEKLQGWKSRKGQTS